MNNDDMRRGLAVMNPIMIILLIAVVVVNFGFRSRMKHWLTDHYQKEEAQYLREAGIKLTPESDLIYANVYWCYHTMTGSDSLEPPSQCADATTSVAISGYPKVKQQEMQKLVAAMESDVY